MGAVSPPFAKSAIAYLRSVGAEEIRLESGGKHCRLVFRHNGRERFHILSWSPGDRVFGETRMLADLRRMTSETPLEKRVGARRARKTPRHKLAVPTSPPKPLATAPMSDFRAALLSHPATDLRALADLAWRAWWRKLMQQAGGESLL